jgi:3-oxoacyl-[acyl-carrier protein] reductase
LTQPRAEQAIDKVEFFRTFAPLRSITSTKAAGIHRLSFIIYHSSLIIIKMALLNGKVALITGGSRGIGEALVRKFVEQGAQVAFTYVSAGSAERAEKLAAELGANARAYQSDAGDYAQAEALVAQVVKDFGKLDILINNAGITRDTLMLRMTEQQWDEVIQTNLKSVFNLTKHCLKPMIRTGGSIINMSSVVGVFGQAGQANYAASKAGIIGFSKSIAKEYGSRGIRCNAVAPGFIETEMTSVLDEKTKEGYLSAIPMKRLGSGEDVANACVYLASDMGAYVSGQVLSVCGALNT